MRAQSVLTDTMLADADTLQSLNADGIAPAAIDTATTSEQKGLWKKLVAYFRDSNKQKTEKKIDFGIIPGPHYSATTGLGLGILGTATYSADRSDPALPRSNASVYTDMTTGGFFLVGLRGNHIFPHERYRLDYKLNLSTFTTSFWGIGYEQGDNDDNQSDYRRNRINALVRFMFRLAPNTYLGPLLNYRYIQARDVKQEDEALWHGQAHTLRTYTAGFSFTYDTRDFILNAQRGVFLQIDQTFSPRFLWNGNHSFSTTDATLAAYKKVWKGGVLAGELHGQFNYGNTPWALLSEVGSNERMRGYYEGRYRDQDLIELQIELRQHIKGRNGIVLWFAAANAFNGFGNIHFSHTLPNGGVGYRWEFKKGINIRIDYGLTRNGGGFIFSINEAF